MAITYKDIKDRIRPLDCSELSDFRGQYFYNRLLINFDTVDFSGCVLLHCYPSGFENAIEVNPAKSEEDVTLIGANLERANLTITDLERANLQGANLQGANLDGVNLAGAVLNCLNHPVCLNQ